jgi:hypothetical protein
MAREKVAHMEEAHVQEEAHVDQVTFEEHEAREEAPEEQDGSLSKDDGEKEGPA